MKKYQVIGGQYERICYGESDTLRGARIISGRHEEYWDNFAGWHKPAIYRAEDCEQRECRDMILHHDGEIATFPKPFAEPVPDSVKD